MYKINIEGQKRYEHVRNEFIRSITIEPIIYSLIMYLVNLSIGTNALLLFYFILSITLMYYVVFGIYAPIRLMKRQNNTISEIVFRDNELVLHTEQVHWLKPRKINVLTNNLSLKTQKFKWYGNKEKEGLSIVVEGIELFLVKDFFDDYEDIKRLIKK